MASTDFLKRQFEQYQAAIDQYNQQLRSYQPKANEYNQKVGIYNAAQQSMGFDKDYYLKNNPDVAAAGMDAWQHFALHGFKEGRRPNAYAGTGSQDPTNSTYVDSDWYKKKYGLGEDVNAFEHYQQNKSSGTYQPNRKATAGAEVYAPEFFNPTEYLNKNPDVAAAGQDPWDHFIYNGAGEKRWRSTGSDVQKPGDAPEFKGVQPKDPEFTQAQMAAVRAPTTSLANEQGGLIQNALTRAPTSISGLLAGVRRST